MRPRHEVVEHHGYLAEHVLGDETASERESRRPGFCVQPRHTEPAYLQQGDLATAAAQAAVHYWFGGPLRRAGDDPILGGSGRVERALEFELDSSFIERQAAVDPCGGGPGAARIARLR